MKTNRFLKLIALALSVFMIMAAFATTAFAADEEEGGDTGAAAPTPVATDDSYDKWDGTDFATEFWSAYDPTALGNGAVIEIDSAAKLAGFSKAVNDAAYGGPNGGTGSGAFAGWVIKITKNIDLMCYEFTSIGRIYGTNLACELIGDVNGAAPVIANLYIPQKSGQNHGFVGNLRGGAMANLTFINATVGKDGSSGGTAIVCGYASKIITKFENITVIDSLHIGSSSSQLTNGIILGTVKTDNDVTFKNLAAINCSQVVNGAAPAAALISHLQQAKNVNYTIENAFISGRTENESYASMAGFVSKVDNVTGESKVTFKNCHYNANIFGDIEDLGTKESHILGVLIGDAGAGCNIVVDNFLCTGTVSGFEDKVAFVGTVGGDFRFAATNVYTTTNMILAGINDTGKDLPAFTATVVEYNNLRGDAATTTLAGFDFTNIWTVRDGKIATLKIAEADDYVAVTTTVPSNTKPAEPTPPDLGDNDTPGNGNGNGNDGTGTGNGNTNTDAPAADDTAKKDDGGCGSVVSATALVTLLSVGMGVTVIRKKKD